jgi:hypothetical protein
MTAAEGMERSMPHVSSPHADALRFMGHVAPAFILQQQDASAPEATAATTGNSSARSSARVVARIGRIVALAAPAARQPTTPER